MTAAKIAITLPVEQLQRVRAAVKRGRAASVSAYISKAVSEQEREESLQELVSDLICQYGEPSKQERAWARRALRHRRG